MEKLYSQYTRNIRTIKFPGNSVAGIYGIFFKAQSLHWFNYNHLRSFLALYSGLNS